MFWTMVSMILGGAFLSFVAGKCRGRNARAAFNYAAWGTWLLLLMFMPFGIIPIPVVGMLLDKIILLAPAVICYILAASSLLKEMRAQKEGEFTDIA